MIHMQFDNDINIAGNNIRFGKLNDRIYIPDATDWCSHDFHNAIEEFVSEYALGKVIAKIPDEDAPVFLQRGYIIEAKVPGYFGNQDALFVSDFKTPSRSHCIKEELNEDILAKVSKGPIWDPATFNQPVTFRLCNIKDVRSLSKLYQLAFKKYGAPVGDSDYIANGLKKGIDYFCVESLGAIIACIRIEYEKDSPNARIDDAVVLDQFRNEGVASALINEAHNYLHRNHIKHIYSTCRASSFAINRVFSRLGYQYGGRLLNNNLVNERICSMNVWSYKLP